MKSAVREYQEGELTVIGLLDCLMEDDRDLSAEPVENLPSEVLASLVEWTQDWETANLPHTRSGAAELQQMRQRLHKVFDRLNR